MNDVVTPLSEPEIAVFMARLKAQIRAHIAEELAGRHEDVKHRQIVFTSKAHGSGSLGPYDFDATYIVERASNTEAYARMFLKKKCLLGGYRWGESERVYAISYRVLEADTLTQILRAVQGKY